VEVSPYKVEVPTIKVEALAFKAEVSLQIYPGSLPYKPIDDSLFGN